MANRMESIYKGNEIRPIPPLISISTFFYTHDDPSPPSTATESPVSREEKK